jgi:hypothetical protein
LAPELRQEARLFRQDRSVPIVPNHVLGPFNFVIERHLRSNHFFSVMAFEPGALQ